MAKNAEHESVDELIARSTTFSESGEFQDAASVLREALQINPRDPRIRVALTNLRDHESNISAWDLCRDYLEKGGDDLGRRAISAAARTRSDEDARKIIDSSLAHQNERSLVGKILAAVLSSEVGRKQLAIMLEQNPTTAFGSLWSYGEYVVKSLTASLLHPSAWSSETSRTEAEKDVFRLLLAKLLEPGVETPETAMSSLARILAVDNSNLREVIEPDTFGIVLSFLDISYSVELRSQATLAIAKLLEVQPDRGKSCLRDFVTSKISRRNSEDLISAFSAAGALFPIVPDMAGELFLTPGFVEDLVALAEKSQSSTLRLSALELLSAACVAKPCRDSISKHCTGWLDRLTREGDSSRDTSLAILILSKLGIPFKENAKRIDDLTRVLKRLEIDSNDSSKENATHVEALAYCSIQPKVKEDLANDPRFLKSLTATLSEPNAAGPVLYGGLTIISNLTVYSPSISAEQKKIAQLKAYANQAKPDSLEDNLNNTVHVTQRIKKVLDAGGASVIMKSLKKASPGTLQLIMSILLSVSRHPIHRRTMAQNGLLQAASTLATRDVDNEVTTEKTKYQASLIVARSLTNLDPALIFNPPATVPFEPTLRVLFHLLHNSIQATAIGSDTESMGETINALQALTNIASLQLPLDPGGPLDLIFKQVWEHADELLYSNITPIRRAFVELLCNMSYYMPLKEEFLQRSRRGDERLRILIAYYGGDDDMDTRLSAAGIFVELLQCPGAELQFIGKPNSTTYMKECLAILHEEPQTRQSMEASQRGSSTGLTGKCEELAVRTLAMTSCLLSPEDEEEHQRAKSTQTVLKTLEHSGVSEELKKIWSGLGKLNITLRTRIKPHMTRIVEQVPIGGNF